jgi:hypothetical protein
VSAADDQARFAARAFVARLEREMGEPMSPLVVERVLFAYEMGYLRGRSDSAQDTSKMFEELARMREEGKGNNGDTK